MPGNDCVGSFVYAFNASQMAAEEARIRTLCTPHLLRGYRLTELLLRRMTGLYNYEIIDVVIRTPRSAFVLQCRCLWRRWFPYTVRGVKLGGGK